MRICLRLPGCLRYAWLPVQTSAMQSMVGSLRKTREQQQPAPWSESIFTDPQKWIQTYGSLGSSPGCEIFTSAKLRYTIGVTLPSSLGISGLQPSTARDVTTLVRLPLVRISKSEDAKACYQHYPVKCLRTLLRLSTQVIRLVYGLFCYSQVSWLRYLGVGVLVWLVTRPIWSVHGESSESKSWSYFSLLLFCLHLTCSCFNSCMCLIVYYVPVLFRVYIIVYIRSS